jgi:hypothetical protein
MLSLMSVDHHALIDRLTGALSRSDWSVLPEVIAPDAVMEFPQSGEAFEGIDNIRGQFADYPQMPDDHISAVEVAAQEQTYALSPNYTLISVGGSGTSGTATMRARYPDGSLWWVVLVYDTDGERVSRAKFYFAPEFEPAEWRAKYRVPSGRGGASG